MCCNSWGRKESDTTERLNLTELKSKKTNSKDKKSCREKAVAQETKMST